MRGLRVFAPLVVAVVVAAGFAPPATQTHEIDGVMRGRCVSMTAHRLVVEGRTVECGCLDGELTSVFQRFTYPGGWEMWVGQGQVLTEDGFACTLDFVCLCPTTDPKTREWIGQHAVMEGRGTGIVSGWLESSGYVNISTGSVGVELHGAVEVRTKDGGPVERPGLRDD